MTTNEKLLELINQDKSVNEISSILKLSNKQIFTRLKTLKATGFNINNKYYYNGDIRYFINKSLKQDDETRIIVDPDQTEFKCIAISDLHIGSLIENIEALNLIYDYCTNNNINIIINTGDLINGSFGCRNKINDLNKQIEYFFKTYPFDKNILNFTCLGDHDLSPLNDLGLDFKKIIDNRRNDIVTVGYESGTIKIKDDEIILRHPINTQEPINPRNALILKGHSHKMRVSTGHANIINVPNLSNPFLNSDGFLPSALKITIKFNKNIFSVGNFEHLIVYKKVYPVSCVNLNLNNGKSVTDYNPKNKQLEKIKQKYVY